MARNFCDVCSSTVFEKESSVEDVQDLTEMEMPHKLEERGEEKGAEPPGESPLSTCLCVVCATAISTITFGFSFFRGEHDAGPEPASLHSHSFGHYSLLKNHSQTILPTLITVSISPLKD